MDQQFEADLEVPQNEFQRNYPREGDTHFFHSKYQNMNTKSQIHSRTKNNQDIFNSKSEIRGSIKIQRIQVIYNQYQQASQTNFQTNQNQNEYLQLPPSNLMKRMPEQLNKLEGPEYLKIKQIIFKRTLEENLRFEQQISQQQQNTNRFNQLLRQINHPLSRIGPGIVTLSLEQEQELRQRQYQIQQSRVNQERNQTRQNHYQQNESQLEATSENLPEWSFVNFRNLSPTAKSCAICLEKFIEKEKIKFLGCLHRFHSTCINQWLTQKSTCPVCKSNAYKFQ